MAATGFLSGRELALGAKDRLDLRGADGEGSLASVAKLFRTGGQAYVIAVAPEANDDEAVLVGLALLGPEWRARVAADAGEPSLEWEASGASNVTLAPPPLAEDANSHRGFGLILGFAAIAMAMSIFNAMSSRAASRALRASEERSRHLATHDSLLGIPNRLLFNAALEEAMDGVNRRGESHGLMYVDVDRFKEINDSLGHDAGDQLLGAFTARIKSALRPHDLLARLGGDEFAILCRDIESAGEARRLAQTLMDRLGDPFEIAERRIVASASIGVALAPLDARQCDEWLRFADEALYRAKNDGRGCFRFFERALDAKPTIRAIVERDLARAFERGEVHLHYQPIFDGRARRVVSVEALLRWRHRDAGMITPELIVEVAEDQGLMLRLGEWILRRACADVGAWPGVNLSVNVSSVQWRDRHFVNQIESALTKSRLDPRRLELELSEGAILEHADSSLRAMNAVRDLGARIALDDFGAGFASLIHVRRFPFDILKIDRGFVRSAEPDTDNLALLRSTVSIGQSLGLTVIAEGVETRPQFNLLRDIGCENYQGFLLARPMPANDVTSLLARAADDEMWRKSA